MEKFKSPRKVEEEIREYKHRRFEYWWKEQDRGALSRPLALTALREEMNYADLRVNVTRDLPSETEEGTLF